MTTTLTDIAQATGAKLEAGRSLEWHPWTYSTASEPGYYHKLEADAALAECHALIMRLVGENKALILAWQKRQDEYEHTIERMGKLAFLDLEVRKALEADLAAANRSADYWNEEHTKLRADLAAMTAERDALKQRWDDLYLWVQQVGRLGHVIERMDRLFLARYQPAAEETP